ncbi:LamG domain-containing protein [archaeon]|nr:LamG domain-containing protein [archaeon]
MNKRGLVFTFITVTLLIIILLAFLINLNSTSERTIRKSEVETETINYFVKSLEDYYLPQALENTIRQYGIEADATDLEIELVKIEDFASNNLNLNLVINFPSSISVTDPDPDNISDGSFTLPFPSYTINQGDSPSWGSPSSEDLVINVYDVPYGEPGESPESSLIVYYNFNNNINDQSGNGNDGSCSNCPTPTEDMHGNLNSAYYFDGINDNIILNEPPDSSTNIYNGTISVWIKTDGGNSGFRGIVVKQMAYSAFLSVGKFGAYSWEIPSSWEASNNVDLQDDLWHHLVVTFQDEVSSGTYFYIDGESAGTGTINILNQDEGIVIGAGDNPASVQYFRGAIDEVRIYNYVLTSGEIQDLFEEGETDSATEELVAHYDFEDDLIDQISTPYNGAYAGSINYDLGLDEGKSVSLDNNDYVYVNDPGEDSKLDFTDAFSVGFWFKADNAVSGFVVKSIVSKYDWYNSFSNEQSFRIYLMGNQLRAGLRLDDGFYTIKSANTDINENQWYCVVVNWDSVDDGYIYLNGDIDSTPFGTSSGSPLRNSNTDLMFGNTVAEGVPSSSYYFDGDIDEVKLWNYKLEQSEITDFCSATPPTFVTCGDFTCEEDETPDNCPLDCALVSEWKFDDSEGGTSKTAIDSIGSNNGQLGDGVCEPGVGSCPVWTNGLGEFISGYALYFDGGDKVMVSSDPSINPSEFTISYWVKSNNGTGSYPRITSFQGNDFETAIHLGTLNYYPTWTDTEYNLNDAVWNHITWTYKSGTLKWYTNGEYRNQGDPSITLTGLFTIGNRYSGTGEGIIGYIDEVRIYKRALQDSDVQELYDYY